MEKKEPNISALMILHSFGKELRDYEVMDLSILKITELNEDPTTTLQKYLKDTNKKTSKIFAKLNNLDYLKEMASEDLGDHGDISEKLHKELWSKNHSELFYILKVDLFYNKSKNYWTGETDIEVEHEYQISDISKEWNDLNLLQLENKVNDNNDLEK